MPSAALFDTIEGWTATPRQAFEALIASEEFVRSGNSQSRPKEGHKLRSNSAAVYMAQWGKFEKWVDDHRLTFVGASQDDLKRFLEEGLDAGRVTAASPATRQRYARLLQRAYARAAQLGAVDRNPVTELLAQQTYASPRAVMPINANRANIEQLQRWLRKRVKAAIQQDPLLAWRDARDCALAALALGSGLRCRELAVLGRSQIRYDLAAPAHERFNITISRQATTATGRDHRCSADALCVPAVELWWQFRFVALAKVMPDKGKGNNTVFPAGLNGLGKDVTLSDSAIYRNLKDLADHAVEEGALEESTRWVLATGASGLRRARIMLDLKAKVDKDLMTERLGFWERRAVRRYQEELDKSGT